MEGTGFLRGDGTAGGGIPPLGGRREFEMAFPKTECAQVTSIVVDMQFGSGKLQERLQTPNGVCTH